MGGAKDSVDSWREEITKLVNSLDGSNQWEKDTIEKLLSGLLSETQKGNQIAAATAKNTENTANGMGAFGARVVGVATAQITEDLGLAFMGS